MNAAVAEATFRLVAARLAAMRRQHMIPNLGEIAGALTDIACHSYDPDTAARRARRTLARYGVTAERVDAEVAARVAPYAAYCIPSARQLVEPWS